MVAKTHGVGAEGRDETGTLSKRFNSEKLKVRNRTGCGAMGGAFHFGNVLDRRNGFKTPGLGADFGALMVFGDERANRLGKIVPHQIQDAPSSCCSCLALDEALIHLRMQPRGGRELAGEPAVPHVAVAEAEIQPSPRNAKRTARASHTFQSHVA